MLPLAAATGEGFWLGPAFVEVFVGYRMFSLELEGRLEQDTVDIDIDLKGFMIGGGVYW